MYGLELVKIGAGGKLLCSLRQMAQDINEQLHLDVLYNMQQARTICTDRKLLPQCCSSWRTV